MRAFLKACLPITRASGSPLSRASLMYSEPRTSSIDERVSLMCAAAKYQPSAKAGMRTWSRVRAGGREPAEVDGEEEDHEQADPEGGHREPEQREDLPRAVPPAVDSHRRDDARREADHQREHHRHGRQEERGGQAGEAEPDDRRPGGESP